VAPGGGQISHGGNDLRFDSTGAGP
jgi:hypothetical protein